MCNACPAGLIGNNQTGATYCVPCPSGTVRLRLRGGCLQCRKTAVENGTLCTAVNPGAPCPQKFFRHADGHCAQCKIWQRLNHDRMVCEECPENHISTGGIDDTCQPCPEHSIRPSYEVFIYFAHTRVTGDQCQCKPGAEPIEPMSSEC